MPTVTLANGNRFSAEPGTTILDAAASQGVVLEHSCRTGRCGACKAQVVSGSAVRLRDASALSEAEHDARWILTCAHEARSDLQLDVDDLGALAGMAVKTLPCRIDTLERLAPDVMRLVLRLPPSSGFRFLAGQYIDLTSPAGAKRSYSLASDCAAPGRLELQIRQVDGGQFSDDCFGQAKPNDLLRFRGPHGTFFLWPVAGLNVVFLATGTGIAPVKSMLAQLAQLAGLPQADRPLSVALYWGGRTAGDLYWDPRPALPSLRYVPVLSREGASWDGARGHVQDVMLAARAKLDDTVVYACGSEAMIRSAEQQLSAAGLPRRRFFSDAFVSSN